MDPILGFFATITIALSSPSTFSSPGTFFSDFSEETILASHEMNMADRHAVKSVNEVFKDNILLNLAYLDGRVTKKQDIKWEDVKGSARYEFRLEPGQTFAYHETVLPEFRGKINKTTNTHFNAAEGYRSSGYLYGDGVCHLASLIYWVAKDAGLEAKAPVNHNFMPVPGISREYGVSIHSYDARQNLYITNNKDNPVTFRFDYSEEKLKLSIVQ